MLVNLSERRRSARCVNQLAETLFLGTYDRDVVEAATIGKSSDQRVHRTDAKCNGIALVHKYYEPKIRKASKKENSPEPLQSITVPILPARARFPLMIVGSVVEPSRICSGRWKQSTTSRSEPNW